MQSPKRFRRHLSLLALATLLGVGSYAAGCGSDDGGALFPTGDGGDGEGDGSTFPVGDGGGFVTDGGGGGDGRVSAITISPASPTVDVTISLPGSRPCYLRFVRH